MRRPLVDNECQDFEGAAMDKNSSCRCSPDEPKTVIFSCAGQSNVGQISNEAGIALADAGLGTYACTAGIAANISGIMTSAREADEVIVIDGCPQECANRILRNAGIPPGRYIVVTEIGIRKGPRNLRSADDIDRVVREVETRQQAGSRNTSSGCGCR
jgi:uncharacterized metal-binding protein